MRTVDTYWIHSKTGKYFTFTRQYPVVQIDFNLVEWRDYIFNDHQLKAGKKYFCRPKYFSQDVSLQYYSTVELTVRNVSEPRLMEGFVNITDILGNFLTISVLQPAGNFSYLLDCQSIFCINGKAKDVPHETS